MAGVEALLRGRQETAGGSSLYGAIRIPLPALEPAEWIPSDDIGLEIIGSGGGCAYATSDSIHSYDVFRISIPGGETVKIAGYDTARVYGKVYLALPLGEQDVILFGRNAIARIQGDTQLWRINITGQVGTVLPDAAGVVGNSISVIYQRVASHGAAEYRLLSFPLPEPPATTNMAVWPLYPLNWTAIENADTGRPLPTAVLAALAPGLEYAVANDQAQSSDGWFLMGQYAVVDVFVADGVPTVSHYGTYFANYPETLGQATASVSIVGGTIVAARESWIDLGVLPQDVPAPTLQPGYAEWVPDYRFNFSLTFDPEPPPEAFWMNLRRAIEVV